MGSAIRRSSRKVRQGFADIYSKYYETYGRRVDLVPFAGTGTSNDAVAAVADAETIARDMRPFMVIGGPALTNAFADTLASRGVICIQCTPGQPNSFYVQHAPYVWDLLMNPEQNGLMVNEYIGKRLARRPAKWAGDAAMHDRTRVFGSVHIALGPDTAALTDILSARSGALRREVRGRRELPRPQLAQLDGTRHHHQAQAGRRDHGRLHRRPARAGHAHQGRDPNRTTSRSG